MLCAYRIESFVEHDAIVVDIVVGVLVSEKILLIETYVNELQIAYVLGEDYA